MNPRASIIINNYNYGRFLAAAIDSALAQTLCDVEVVVVDDGSTDDSRDVIARYAGRVTAILKSNGGQASALNAGFAASRGEYICFLDADDMLLPDALARALAACDAPGESKVHWPLRVVDIDGADTGRLLPDDPLPAGDLRAVTRRDGPCVAANPPTSGNLWSRWFLDAVLPIPEDDYRICADAYLLALAPAHGLVRRLDAPAALYRQHGANNFWQQPFDDAVRKGVRAFDLQCEALAAHYRRAGEVPDVQRWKVESWWHKLERLVHDLARIGPGTLALADGELLDAPPVLAGHRRRPFPERDGAFGGMPEDDDEALAALADARSRGADYFAIAWPMFWWIDEYPRLLAHLREGSAPLLDNDRVLLFDLRREGRP